MEEMNIEKKKNITKPIFMPHVIREPRDEYEWLRDLKYRVWLALYSNVKEKEQDYLRDKQNSPTWLDLTYKNMRALRYEYSPKEEGSCEPKESRIDTG
jgi:hypothetical protein